MVLTSASRGLSGIALLREPAMLTGMVQLEGPLTLPGAAPKVTVCGLKPATISSSLELPTRISLPKRSFTKFEKSLRPGVASLEEDLLSPETLSLLSSVASRVVSGGCEEAVVVVVGGADGCGAHQAKMRKPGN